MNVREILVLLVSPRGGFMRACMYAMSRPRLRDRSRTLLRFYAVSPLRMLVAANRRRLRSSSTQTKTNMKPGLLQYLSVLAAIAASAQLTRRACAQPAAARSPTVPAPVAPAIARPAPNAPPEKVEDAEKTAQASALTPITPQPREPTRPAVQLYAEIDIPILAVGLVFVGGRFLRTQKAFCAPRCDPADLNSLDRTTAGTWSPRWATGSNVGLISLSVGA